MQTTTTKLFQEILEEVAPLPISSSSGRKDISSSLFTFRTKPTPKQEQTRIYSFACSLQTSTHLDELPEKLSSGLSEGQLAAIQAHLRFYEALRREQVRDYTVDDAPYPLLKEEGEEEEKMLIQKTSLDGLSGPLVRDLAPEELEAVGPWFLALKQYLACERVLATGTPYFWPLPFNHSNLGCIKLYLSNVRQKNAIGKVLGPNGSTQREIEAMTNTTVRVRGQLSECDRAVTGRADHCYTPGDADTQHIRVENGTVLDKLLAVRLLLGILTPFASRSDALKATQLAGYAEALGLHVHSTVNENTAPWKGLFEIALKAFENERERTISTETYREALRFRQECLLVAKAQLGLTKSSRTAHDSDPSEEELQAPGA
ncbi:hypothetical protein GMRT_10971 [Giardia muris]|uniref:K Homology domain-containing protein n=1 Tax=Giardia muris TaxID=5742 RepID=A0A4Z1STU4_GIAMU|nr:hypothetical protein GMRT_10971 [Giardia muris]|eukprot:TNJ29342.1 hypothetical protein GMRT_10971 [Giardia muris]